MTSLKQELRQSQQLVMTHQLQQSIKLLQLSAIELQEFIDVELEKNPLLIREEGETEANEESPDTEAAENENDAETAGDAPEVTVSDSDYSVTETLEDESFSGEWAQGDTVGTPEISAASHSSGGTYDEDSEGFGVEGASARDKTLREHLREQIHMDIADPVTWAIAEQLTDMLDDAGYLREDTASLASTLGITTIEIDAVIEQLQQMDPPGVFARSLAECLRLQLREMNRLDPVMEIFLDHLDLMGSGELKALQKKCGVDDEDFVQILADVRRCNPKPGHGFSAEDTQAIIPDVLVRRAPGGGWQVELNPDALPRVLINNRYATEVGARTDDKEAKKFMTDQLANANWLMKALDQRANTILKVASAIVTNQEKFLQHGIRFLKPLVLKDIATAIGMHESTVSRVTTAKYIATPRGTLELKFFFTSSINAAGGATDFSSKTVMYYIKELVAAETATGILSDDAIVKRLKDRNIDVARRTVTKYREEMGIPSSVVRRRQKRG